MLKTTGLPNGPASSRNDGSRPVSNRNNGSRLVSERNDGDGEVDRFGDNGIEYAKKSRKSKGQKLSKSRKSKGKKSKKPSKSENSLNFGATESGANFLTSSARKAFNRLWLGFTKAPIL